MLFNTLTLNVYKNFLDDIWYNEIINIVSNNYTIIDRIEYVYYVDGKGEGNPKFRTKKTKKQSNMGICCIFIFWFKFL